MTGRPIIAHLKAIYFLLKRYRIEGPSCGFPHFACWIPYVMHPAFFTLPSRSLSTSIPPLFQDPSFSQFTQQQRNKGIDNSSIDDTRNTVLLLQTDYKTNRRCYCPSPRRHPGPHSRLLLRRAYIPLLPSTTRRTDEPDDRLQTSPFPQSTSARRQRLPCLWVGDLEPEQQHGEDG